MNYDYKGQLPNQAEVALPMTCFSWDQGADLTTIITRKRYSGAAAKGLHKICVTQLQGADARDWHGYLKMSSMTNVSKGTVGSELYEAARGIRVSMRKAPFQVASGRGPTDAARKPEPSRKANQPTTVNPGYNRQLLQGGKQGSSTYLSFNRLIAT